MFIVFGFFGLIFIILTIIFFKKLHRTALGTISILFGTLFIVVAIIFFICTLCLVDGVDADNKIEQPIEQTVDQPVEEPGEGGDWSTWRGYSAEYTLTDNLSICFSAQTSDNFYAVYDSVDGTRIGTLLLGNYLVENIAGDFFIQDYNGDGVNDIGVQMDDNNMLWFSYQDEAAAWPEDITGGFHLIEGEEEYPYVQSAYFDLTENQELLYNEMKGKIDAMESFSYEADIYGCDTLDDIYIAWIALSNDYPEIDNFFYINEITDDEGGILSLDSCYECIWEEEQNQDIQKVETGLELFEQTCDDIIEQMPKECSTYDKYYYLAAALSERVDYDYTFEKPANYTPYCIVTGDGICQGYAKAYQYLCMKTNLWCEIVSGSSNGESHAWNKIYINGVGYHVDITWADEQGEPASEGWLEYFMLTTEEILEDHEIIDEM